MRYELLMSLSVVKVVVDVVSSVFVFVREIVMVVVLFVVMLVMVFYVEWLWLVSELLIINRIVGLGMSRMMMLVLMKVS